MNNRALLFLIAACSSIEAIARDYPIKPVPFTDVHIQDEFWRPRLETNRKVTVWYDFKKCEETGRIDNFAKAGRLMPGEFRGTYFDDSDVYKAMEGAAYCLAVQADPKLDQYLDALIARIGAAQEPDGYLYTCRTINPAKAPKAAGPTRWSNEVESHELYCAGHMYEAAVAHYQVTGKRTFLEIAIKNADLIDRTFGPGRLHDVPGHEEIEIGLVKLSRVTGEERYLQLAKFFIDQRGRTEGRKTNKAYDQDHKPFIEQDEPVGHAVRAGYLYSGAADVAAITGDESYSKALDKIWNNLVSSKLYLTGGIGAKGGGEAFGEPYELPNASAYAETCAAIANAMWNQRMFLLHGDAKYVDVLERVIYNGFLSGVSLSGDLFFYVNPLESGGEGKFNQGMPTRSPWFGCACCPVNVVRFLPSIPGYLYATRDDAVYVNLYAAGEAAISVGGKKIRISQKTRYPWEGRVEIGVEPGEPAEFNVKVRIPGWARGEVVPGDLYQFADTNPEPFRITVNGAAFEVKPVDGYVAINRRWTAGDRIVLDLPMPVRRIKAHDRVEADRGRIALQRGPILYCLEGVDNGPRLLEARIDNGATFKTIDRPDLLGGVTLLSADNALELPREGESTVSRLNLTAVPYYAWNHRGATQMAVFINQANGGANSR